MNIVSLTDCTAKRGLTVANKGGRGGSESSIPQTSDSLLLDSVSEQLESSFPTFGLLSRLDRVDRGEDHPETCGCETTGNCLDQYWPGQGFEESQDTGIGGGVAKSSERALEAASGVNLPPLRCKVKYSHGRTESGVISLETSIVPQFLRGLFEASTVSVLIVHNRPQWHQGQDLDDHCCCSGNTATSSRFECSDEIKVELVRHASTGERESEGNGQTGEEGSVEGREEDGG